MSQIKMMSSTFIASLASLNWNVCCWKRSKLIYSSKFQFDLPKEKHRNLQKSWFSKHIMVKKGLTTEKLIILQPEKYTAEN